MPKSRRIALVADNFPSIGGSGGIGSYCKSVALFLASRGHEVHIFAFGGQVARQKLAPAVTIWSLVPWKRRRDMPLRASVHFTVRYRAEARRLNALQIRHAVSAVAHAQGPFDILEAPEFGGLGSLVARGSTRSLAIRLHGPASLTLSQAGRSVWRGMADPERDSALSADVLTAPSEHVLRECRALWGVDLTHARVIPNPVEWHPRQRVKQRAVDILFVGRLEESKGIDLLASALKLIPGNPVVAAAGLDGKLRSSGTGGELLLDATNGRARLLGPVSHSRLREIARHSRLLVAPSRWESFGLVVVEAMMWGLPVVASDIPPFTELTDGGRVAALFESGSAVSLATSLGLVLESTRYAEDLADAAYSHAQRYRVETVVPQLFRAWHPNT